METSFAGHLIVWDKLWRNHPLLGAASCSYDDGITVFAVCMIDCCYMAAITRLGQHNAANKASSIPVLSQEQYQPNKPNIHSLIIQYNRKDKKARKFRNQPKNIHGRIQELPCDH